MPKGRIRLFKMVVQGSWRYYFERVDGEGIVTYRSLGFSTKAARDAAVEMIKKRKNDEYRGS
jgi:hypothetical protein